MTIRSGVWRHPPPPQVFLGFGSVFLKAPPLNLGGGGAYGDPGVWRKQPPTQDFSRQRSSLLQIPSGINPVATPISYSELWRVRATGRYGVFRNVPEVQIRGSIIAPLTVIQPFPAAILAYKGPIYWAPETFNQSKWSLPPPNWAAVIVPTFIPLAIGPEVSPWKDPYSVEYQSQPANNPWAAILSAANFNPLPPALFRPGPVTSQWRSPYDPSFQSQPANNPLAAILAAPQPAAIFPEIYRHRRFRNNKP